MPKVKKGGVAAASKPKAGRLSPMPKPNSGRAMSPEKSPSARSPKPPTNAVAAPVEPRLSSLSREALARIFDIVFSSTPTALIASKKSIQKRVLPPPPALLRVCKEIHRKLINHYYSSTEFFIQHHESNSILCRLPVWLESIGKIRAELLRSVHIAPAREVELKGTDVVARMTERCELARATLARGVYWESHSTKSKGITLARGVLKTRFRVVSRVKWVTQRALWMLDGPGEISKLPVIDEWTADPDELLRQWKAEWSNTFGTTFKWPPPASGDVTFQR
ncbi:hypothetical protein Slin15195_G018930 [Septoria linicola]|uniref:Uncharacterized protein n=1 Tax=Septoria linicola TaxID=215465 RepID=A0A9Q9AFN3_9PEZI|nr:hypothetical protein Slin15195_G018930 [Septoria linicola]